MGTVVGNDPLSAESPYTGASCANQCGLHLEKAWLAANGVSCCDDAATATAMAATAEVAGLFDAAVSSANNVCSKKYWLSATLLSNFSDNVIIITTG